MAPPPRNKSVVDNVVAKLSSADQARVSKELIKLTEERLRILEARKVVIGQLGKGDRIESRAAIILDDALRQNGGAPIAKLEKTCGMSKKDFKILSEKVGNYLADKSKSKRSTNTSISSRSSTRLQVKDAPRTSIISMLSVKLGSHIPDSHGFAKLAQLVLKDMQVHVSGYKNKFNRNGYMQDMNDHLKEYEAVCFYLIMEENQIKDTEQIKPMLLEVANVQSNKFKSVYVTAKKFFDELRLIERSKKKRSLAASDLIMKPNKRTKTSKTSKSNKTATELLELAESNDVVLGEELRKPLKKYVYSDSFQEWRSQVLVNAMTKAREQDEGTVSDAQALHKAADAALSKYGISTSS